jgi:hypothetical protein
VFGSAEAQRGDSLQEISDGGNKALEDYAAKRGLSYIGGPERRVFACTGGEGVSKVATVPVSRATLPFSLPSVRFGVGSEDFLKNSQTGALKKICGAALLPFPVVESLPIFCRIHGSFSVSLW